MYTKIKKGSGTNFWCTFSAWFFHKNVPYLMLHQLTEFQCQTFFPSQDIKQNVLLKLVSTISNFYFSPNDILSKTMKNVFLFHLKSSFCSQDIQIFVFPSSPFFLPVSHCFRGCLKISLKVYDAINCLNKNLITHLF